MGIYGLTRFIHELAVEHDVLKPYKLHNCKVIIDGCNLLYSLYGECIENNGAFGGNFDKYSNVVQHFFEGLQSCGVTALVVMDGGLPMNYKKLKTTQERAIRSIEMWVDLDPESDYGMVPNLCREVLVSTLHNMGILVIQSDFEADDEIAALARNLNCIVISADSDFYMVDVLFVPLPSLEYWNIQGSEEKFIPCQMFNIETFCQMNRLNRTHLALLGTLMGNDFVDREKDLAKFHKETAFESVWNHKKVPLGRTGGGIIQCVIKWVAWRKQKTVGQIIDEVVGSNSLLKEKILQSVDGYTMQKSVLLDAIPYIIHTNQNSDGKVAVQQTAKERIEYVFDTRKSGLCQQVPQLGTDLVLKNGQAPPFWFVKAFREGRIVGVVANMLMEDYFFSFCQLECKSLVSSYLAVEPIVRSVYTILCKGCDPLDEISEIPTKSEYMSLKDSKGEEDENLNKLKCIGNLNIDDNEENHGMLQEYKQDILVKPLKEATGTQPSNSNSPKKKKFLSWYIREGMSLWCKHVEYLEANVANQLPSLSEVGDMAACEKKLVFYKMMHMEQPLNNQDLPDDFEMILNFIIYWFKNSKLELNDCHGLTVLVCVFMYYIIDRKIGCVRTQEGFERVNSCQAKVLDLLKDPCYSKPDASVVDLLTSISSEECLVAGSHLFKYHLMDERMSMHSYKKEVVHAFSEYQACVGFLQLLNSFLCSPFPFLSIEFLWGGAFSYNVFVELSRSNYRIAKVRKILGEGTSLEKLFCKFFCKLEDVITFSKPSV